MQRPEKRIMSPITVIYIINIFVSIFIIFAERKRPSATIAWVMLLFVLPGIGIVLYIMGSQLLARYRLSSLSSSLHFRDNPFLVDQKRSINEGSFRSRRKHFRGRFNRFC